MSELILVLTPESQWERLDILSGWSDIPLSDKGRHDARCYREMLRNLGVDLDVMITSYLTRDLETARILSVASKGLEILQDYRLNTRHLGRLQGIDKIQIEHRYGKDYLESLLRNPDAQPQPLDESDERNPNHQKKYQDIPEPLPLSESRNEARRRILMAYHSRILPLLSTDTVIVICQKDVLEILREELQDSFTGQPELLLEDRILKFDIGKEA